MKNVYIEKNNNSMEYFIGNFKDCDEEFFEIKNTIASIAESAFAHSSVEKILFKNCSPNIGEKAFEGCESLTTVIFGDFENGKSDNNETYGKSVLKNLTLASAGGDYTVQANAFKDCAKLTTLVLPELNSCCTLTIKECAFCGCQSLRTVVALCDNIVFAGNPFTGSPKHLTFVCKKDSEVVQFANGNGYRSVCIA